jgi:hypothetical protein
MFLFFTQSQQFVIIARLIKDPGEFAIDRGRVARRPLGADGRRLYFAAGTSVLPTLKKTAFPKREGFA